MENKTKKYEYRQMKMKKFEILILAKAYPCLLSSCNKFPLYAQK